MGVECGNYFQINICMTNSEQLSIALKSIADACVAASRQSTQDEERVLYHTAVNVLLQVASLTRNNMHVPQLHVYGPAIPLIQDGLEEAGFKDNFDDYAVHQEVVFVARMYLLNNPLYFIRLKRVPTPLHENEDSQGVFSRRFIPNKLLLQPKQ